MLLMPLVTILAAAAITGEAITPPFVVGGSLVIAGVYVGAIRRRRDARPVTSPEATARRVAVQPGCF
jgi:LPXTG-motif cell wall-anchored protein